MPPVGDTKNTKQKRYNLVVPQELFDQLEQLAEDQHTSVVEMIRRFVKLGLLAAQIQKREDAALVLREGDREREIMVLL